MSDSSITSRQCKAARALLMWKQKDLALKIGVSMIALNRFENMYYDMTESKKDELLKLFESEGLTFKSGGVVFKKDQP